MGPRACVVAVHVVRCSACPMRPLATPCVPVHDLWWFGRVLAEIRALVCCILCASVAVGSAVVGCTCLCVLRRITVLRGAELGSIFELGGDLRRF